MAMQTIVWTVLPNGRVTQGSQAGQLRVSIVVSPRLTPQSSNEQVLQAFDDWRDWPGTLARAKFALRTAGRVTRLEVVSQTDPMLWNRLLPLHTPVAGFQFKDMSQVNLRSFSVRNVLGLVREHYSQLAVDSPSRHPTLLPWQDANPSLKNMLTDCGTPDSRAYFAGGSRSRGFDRFLGDGGEGSAEERLRAQVFGTKSVYRIGRVGVGLDQTGQAVSAGEFGSRTLPPDWREPANSNDPMSLWNTAAEYTLYQANRFYQRTRPSAEQQAMRRPTLTGIPAVPGLPEMDFHRILASYADYPALLRRLGLVIDCVLPPGSAIDKMLAGLEQAQGEMCLEVGWGNGAQLGQDACPSTAWMADRQRFFIRSRDSLRLSDYERGLLKLRFADENPNMKERRGSFDVYQVDPDSTALKTVGFVLTAQNLLAKSQFSGREQGVTYTTGDEQAVAALRSGGVGVSSHGRAVRLARDAAAAALKNKEINARPEGAQKIALFIEDVLRGYRVDVQETGAGGRGPWRSLCQRHGLYRYINSDERIKLPDDEGYVKGASVTSAAGDASAGVDPDDYYLHESLFRWTGWSLAAPRPGRTLRANEDAATGVQGETPETVSDAAIDGGNGLAVDFRAVRNSLPRLRFGSTYRFRARLVDLAGNSLAFDDASLADDDNCTNPLTYRRFEPVDPPVLVQRHRHSEGESLERMVIRSNWNADATAYLQTAVFAAAIALPDSADFDYRPVNERHVVPPKSSQQQCETHGLFDAWFDGPDAIKIAYEIACRDAGSLYDDLPGSQVELITPAALQQVATTSSLPPRLPSPDNPTGDRLAPGQYVIHREAQVKTPYLPDGAAGGFALRAEKGHALPGVTEPMILGPQAWVIRAPNEELVLMVGYDDKWPNTLGLRIVLAERKEKFTDPPCQAQYADDGLPKWDPGERVLTLFVSKGQIVRLRYSSFVHGDLLDTMGMLEWAKAQGAGDRFRYLVQLGCHWMITPYRRLVLVHATQQPVCEPELLELAVKRAAGDVYAGLQANVRLHGPSTGKIEIEAEWDDWVDDPENPAGPQRQTSRGMLGEIPLAENSRNLFTLSGAINDQQVPGGSTDRARGDRHEFGDTKFRLIRYRLRATTRFREYLPAALYEQSENVTRLGPVAGGPLVNAGANDDPGAPVLVQSTGAAANSVVPASAPPDEPVLLYVLPTFLWHETPSASSGLNSIRRGNGLRVWLDRPWFSSGNGELLGVVILGNGGRFADIPGPLQSLVTQWGLDPFWDTELTKPSITGTDFPARVAYAQNVPLLEQPTYRVNILGHRVHWDAQRAQWYCDIELDPGKSYMPFVRLALVRYQPNAIDGAKVSRVVLADFAQVLPQRQALFERKGAKLGFTLRGRVPDYGPMQHADDMAYLDIPAGPVAAPLHDAGRNKVELVLQTRDPDTDSDLAWTDVSVLASNMSRQGSGLNFVVREAIKDAAKHTVLDVVKHPVPPYSQLLLDPVIWETELAWPNAGNRPARVVVREYERYYTDRSLRETGLGGANMRRVVAERLVYTAFFAIEGSA
ncbi:hypothetical protein H0A66_15860 [Alcaligenaceae bacterium]|nr:hypothetical protein [Alcaligenaceae bacterium]